jgi:replicative DNA helicase
MNGKKVLFISLEQSRKEIVGRFAAMHARIDSEKIRRGSLDERELWEIKQSANEVSGYPIEIIDTAGQTTAEIYSAARMLSLRRGLDLVVVDYLQFVKPTDHRMPREQQVAGISRDLKNMAKQLNVPVVALAQMTRDIEKREDKTPRMSDLRESGAIEQDADMIMFLDRPGSWDKNADQSEASLIIRKFRNGNPGTVPLRWDGSCMLFQDAALSGQAGSDPFSGGGFTTWDPFASDTQGDF